MLINVLQCGTKNGGGIKTVMDLYENNFHSKKISITTVFTHESRGVGSILFFINSMIIILYKIIINRIDIIHCHMSMRGSFFRKLLIFVVAKIFRKKYVLHIHGSETKKFIEKSSKLVVICYCFLLDNSDIVIVLSESWKKYFNDLSKRAKIFVLNNSVPIPEKIIDNVSVKKVLFLGEVGRRKGVYDLIDSWGSVFKINKDAELIVCGGLEQGFDLAMLDPLLNIKYMGWIDEARRSEILSERPIFVLPSYNEGLPMSLIEAMSYGCPVISTRVGGIPELINNGVNGFLINPGDKDLLGEFILNLMNKKDIAKYIGDNGRNSVAKRYSSDFLMNVLEGIYIKLVGSYE